MKVLLIQPSNYNVWKGIKKTALKLDRKAAKTPSAGIAYIAGMLQANKIDVDIFDAEAFNLSNEQAAKEILKKNPDLVGFTCTTPLINSSLEIAQEIKKVNSKIKVLLGGPHISALPKESLMNEQVDFIIRNEGELATLELVNELSSGGDLNKIKGLGFKKDGKPILNPLRPLLENLDELPFPARNLWSNDRYLHGYTNEKFTVMVSSRGCPYQCIFCDSSITFGNRTRFRSPDNVIEEIRETVDKYGIKNIVFVDDTFTLDKKRTIEICKKIIENKLDISFICNSRANTIDEERLKWLKKAGCWQIYYGIESGNDRILKIIKKGITTEQARKAIKLTKEAGISTHASYMIGNPGETKETIQQTIDFAKELDSDYAQFSILIPFPGTEVWDMAKEKGLIKTRDFSKFCWYYSSVSKFEGLNPEELIEIQRKAYEEYRGGKQGIKEK